MIKTFVLGQVSNQPNINLGANIFRPCCKNNKVREVICVSAVPFLSQFRVAFFSFFARNYGNVIAGKIFAKAKLSLRANDGVLF